MNRIPALLVPPSQPDSQIEFDLGADSTNSSKSPSCPLHRERMLAARARQIANELYLDTNFAHRIFLPHNFTPSYDYPLVIWMHSDQSSEMEIDAVMESLSDQNYIAVAPRASIRSSSKRRLFRWGNSRTDFAFGEDAVGECISGALDLLPVRMDSIFLAGYGGGGTMAQWVGLQFASQIAGVVSLNGAMPRTGGALANWKMSRHLPVLFSQRRNSTLCSNTDMQEAMRFAHRAGLNYRFSTLWSEQDSFDEADELSSSMLAVANRFIMGIVTNTDIGLEPEQNRDHLVGPFGVN